MELPPLVDFASNQELDSNSDSESQSENGDQQGELTTSRSNPFFFPPLFIARRTKIMDILREEQIGSVADLGCGTGAVLQILSTPANHLDDFPAIYPDSPVSKSPVTTNTPTAKERKRLILKSIPTKLKSKNELHLRRLVGVDVDRESLESSIQVTLPKPLPVIRDRIDLALEEEEDNFASWSNGDNESERWEELRVEIYLGSAFDVYNEALTSLDGMFATEVIEHLSPTSLSKFSSRLLGVYQPRILIVTTPNHEFNPYFPSSSSSGRNRSNNNNPVNESGNLEESAHRFPDPTLRTKRVFRDSDHQFEWTENEFQTWAKKSAEEFDYSVTFTGVGSLVGYYGFDQPIPFPPPSLSYHPELKDSPNSIQLPINPNTFFATQIAIFKKNYSQEAERSPRSHRATPLPFFSPPTSPSNSNLDLNKLSISSTPKSNGKSSNPTPMILKSQRLTSNLALTPHQHLKTHIHPPHPLASEPQSHLTILNEMKRLIDTKFQTPVINLRDFWNVKSLRLICGGFINSIVEAVLESGEHLEEGEEDEWDFILLVGGIQSGRELKGDEALGIIWKNYIETIPNPYDEDQIREEEEEFRRLQEEEAEEEEYPSDDEWRLRAAEFLVDDFDQVENNWAPQIGGTSSYETSKTSDVW